MMRACLGLLLLSSSVLAQGDVSRPPEAFVIGPVMAQGGASGVRYFSVKTAYGDVLIGAAEQSPLVAVLESVRTTTRQALAYVSVRSTLPLMLQREGVQLRGNDGSPLVLWDATQRRLTITRQLPADALVCFPDGPCRLTQEIR